MRLFLLTLVATSSAGAQDVMDIVHAYSAHEASRWNRSRDYTYQRDLIRRTFKRDGTLKSSTSETYEVLIVNGKPVSRLIQRNGQPVTDEATRKRQQQLDQVSAQAARFGPFRSIEKRYDSFVLNGEEEIDGRAAWVVSAKKGRHGIARTQAKLWIDELDYECAKLQIEGTMNLITIDGRAHGVLAPGLSLCEWQTEFGYRNTPCFGATPTCR